MERLIRGTVGVVDLNHYNEYARKHGDSECLDLLQKFYYKTGNAVLQSGGEIIGYAGDALIFFIHAGGSVDAHVQALKKVCTRKYAAHIGLATGEMLYSRIGHPSKTRSAVSGGKVREAFILCNEAGLLPEGIVMDMETQQRIEQETQQIEQEKVA